MKHPNPSSLNIFLGNTGIWPFRRYFGSFLLNEKQRRTHKRVHGITGQGKSTLMARYDASLIYAGISCIVLDPHKKLTDDILALLEQWGYFKTKGFKNFIYVDFSRRDRFLPFNFLNQPYDIDIVAKNFVEVCRRAWPNLKDGASPLFDQIMLASAMVLVANKLPLTKLFALLRVKPYRQKLLSSPAVSNQLRDFFNTEFDRWTDQADKIGSSTRRAFVLTIGKTLFHSLGHMDNKLQFRDLMDNNISVLINLHGLDDETQKLLGCLIMVSIEQAAKSRTSMKNEIHVNVDEFNSFGTRSAESFERLLSEARKFNVFIEIAYQINAQLPEKLLKEIENMQTEIHFRMSHDDAVYEAPRLFDHNPYRKKSVPVDEKVRDKQNPLYFPMQEFYDEKAKELKNLHTGEAYVKVNRNLSWPISIFFPVTKTTKIQTQKLGIKKESFRAINTIKEYYTKKYYFDPKEKVKSIRRPKFWRTNPGITKQGISPPPSFYDNTKKVL